MKTTICKPLAVILALALLIGIVPACTYPVEAAESYVAMVPGTLHSGGTESVSLTLLKGDRLVPGRIEISLLKQGTEVYKVEEDVDGKGTITLDMPVLEEGDYEIKISGAGFEDKAPVKVENSFLAFVETDKPIYKPGQTAHIRAITLDSDLKPVSQPLTIEVLDAKGIKIFRDEITTDDFGMASLDLPISEEPNLGVWKITAIAGKGKSQLDIRVEKYVLPKYEVKVELPREWFLVDEAIKGKISADYSFGKPVKGELEIKASRYVGKWEQYATFSKPIDGEIEFELPAARYVAGVPGAGGMGNVTLDITVKEKSTGYEEKTSKLLTVAQSPLSIQLIPEGAVFMPGLPFSFLIVTQSPDNELVDAKVNLTITYLNSEFNEEKKITRELETAKGKATIELEPPANAVALIIEAFELTPISSREPAHATKTVQASYSPSGNFIHVEQVSEGIPKVGDGLTFKVYSTSEAANFYYEVISRGRVIFSDFTGGDEIAFDATPLMAPSSRLLVYQILPNSEVAADYVPFKVEAGYPHEVEASFSAEEARPGEEVTVEVQTNGEAMVGIAAVDKSVFILAENRMNLQQVFDELERLYMKPQAELHEVSIYPTFTTKGAKDIIQDAGVIVLTNQKVPEGKQYQSAVPPAPWMEGGFRGDAVPALAPAPTPAPTIAVPAHDAKNGLAEVSRVRQYFPETWLWELLPTGADGKGSLKTTVPDSITTWMLRAVALSKQYGLGVAEAQLRVFQPFFASIDLPYSAVRGEEFPIRVAVYNYLETPQQVRVQVKAEPWFDLLDEPEKTIEIAGNDIGAAEFRIRTTKLGINDLQVTVQSREAADALIKQLIVVPEGVSRENIQNLVLANGTSKVIEIPVPPSVVPDSGRAYVAVTSSYLTQTMEGLEALIQMPFGCGEQNMIVFAPDVFITRYLKESGQLKPEIMAKAEKLMITGYQRELVYRRNDGSFSAFGQSDQEGSLWLTAFVLKSFAQARDLMYIDESILSQAKEWITSHQNKDGSFESVGFVHHQEMMGGLQGKTALTAYVAIALMEAGDKTSAAAALGYLEGELGGMTDPYTLAITAYALELGGSGRAAEAHQKLMAAATEDENGLHWGAGGVEPEPLQPKIGMPEIMPPPQTSGVEATAYATLALVKHRDMLNASKAAKWLVSRRNAYGGYGSTQDTVVALQALTEQAAGSRADVDLRVIVKAEGVDKELSITEKNFDVLQVVEIPANGSVEITAAGKGEVIAQVVTRYNLPQAEKSDDEILKLDVSYDTTEVEVNDLVTVSVNVAFEPPVPMEAGMIVLDVSVPTGFAPVTDSIADVLKREPMIKRYDIAGRKVIFYVENMVKGDRISFSFKVQAQYPVKAKGVSSQAYSYYKPEIKGESLSKDMVVK